MASLENKEQGSSPRKRQKLDTSISASDSSSASASISFTHPPPPPPSSSPLGLNTTTTTTTAPPNSNISLTSTDRMEIDQPNQSLVSDAPLSSKPEHAQEAKCGILCYVNKQNPGFQGTLKQRYTDFLVNEISLGGEVVHLKDIKAPQNNEVRNTSNINTVSADIIDENQSPARVAGQTEATNQTSTDSAVTTTGPAQSISNDSTTAGAPPLVDSTNPRLSAPITVTAESSGDVTAQPSTEEPNVIQIKEITPNDMEILVEYFGNTLAPQIVEFDRKIQQKPNAKPSAFGSLQSEPIDDRPRRGRIHGFVRSRFESRLETEALDDNSIKIFAAAPQRQDGRGQNQRGRGQQGCGRGNFRGQSNGQLRPKGKVGWQELGGEYLHFTLYKENKDTMEAVSLLAKLTRTGPKDFAYAGTKDRRAVTAQRISAFRHHATNMAEMNNKLRYGTKVGDFKYEKHPLRLGDLEGNFFTITLRDCQFGGHIDADNATKVQLAEKIVGDAIEHLQTHGFLNYFGLQRFGTFAIGTHEIGKFILRGNFKGAVDALLTFSEDALAAARTGQEGSNIGRDDMGRAVAIQKFRETGKNHCKDHLPPRFSAERAVIQHMCSGRGRDDYAGAILSIPRHLRTMYVHSYQSFIWNIVASKRWERYGDKVIEGDLVLVDSKAPEQKDEVDENGEIVVHASGGDAALTSDDVFQRARCLSAEEANSGSFTIFDIVLPTPGYDIEYPRNEIGDCYKEFMASEQGGGLDPADMRRKIKDFSLSGSYRHLIGQVKEGLSFEVRTYHDEKEQLVETDLEIINKRNGQMNGPRHIETTHVFTRKEGDAHGYASFHGDNSRQDNGQQQKIAPHNAASSHGDNSRQDNDQQRKTAQHNAWQALPAKLAREDKAAAAAWEAEKLIGVDLHSFQQPIYKETFIQTSVNEQGRQTGVRVQQTLGPQNEVLAEKILKDEAVIEKKPKVEVTVVPVAESDKDNEPQENAKVAASLGLKRPAEDISKASVEENKKEEAATKVVGSEDEKVKNPVVITPEIKEEAKPSGSAELTSIGTEKVSVPVVEEVAEETRPARLAVIVKFGLGSSMYATMALRELMQQGGVQVYQPDFSSGR
ncbi:hypothetical protein EYC80_000051 [Monilinia laxa]|uniref:TRUD domain-containing protein n=1 Tax=Monilinia laxa TaxID=61186 RepID=A0A5N6KAC5_MONLA|nr:hypothetical protein EYC80_000051 [Monilinia laxa]